MIIKIILIVLAVSLFVFLLYLLIGSIKGHACIKHITFDEHSIVFGSKGSGKSLTCSLMANYASKRYGYVSNTDFGGLYVHALPKEISVAPNTFNDVINGTIKPIKVNPYFYCSPVILDDVGVYLPNWCDSLLKKEYPSMPLAFALWRHFYDAPIHLNCQDVERPWKLLKEQQVCYLYCLKATKLPFGLIKVCFIYYDRLESASLKLKPYKALFGNKYSKADKVNFDSMHGTVKQMFYITRTKIHSYDSQYFHKVFFGNKFPSKKELRSILREKRKNLKSHI